jgi:pimeloyl-ACP methyl ester carboxylesterase
VTVGPSWRSRAGTMGIAPQPATWLGPSGGREEALYLDGGLITFTHLPPGKPAGGVVVCSPLGIAFRRNYRREVLLARSLAAAGFAVQRFHYRGTGSSFGEPEDMTFERMREDALEAAARLAGRAGATTRALVGTRLGALVAASASADLPGARLALWEPVEEGSRYFEEASRVRSIQHLRLGSGGPGLSPAAEIERTGSADILGHRVHEPLYRSLVGRSLARETGTDPRPILLVRSRRGGDALGAVLEGWRDQGFPVELHLIDQEEGWWFSDPRELTDEAKESSGALVEATTRWIEQQRSGGSMVEGVR